MLGILLQETHDLYYVITLDQINEAMGNIMILPKYLDVNKQANTDQAVVRSWHHNSNDNDNNTDENNTEWQR